MFAPEVHTFFDGWDKVGRVVVLAICAYLGLVVMLRASGKRTLTKLNVYDFVFVVALGSVLAATVLTPEITLAEGLAATAVLIAMQFGLSMLSVTSAEADALVNGEPTLVFHSGDFLWEIMKRERVSPEEVTAAARQAGKFSLDEIDSIVLETDGTFSVIGKSTHTANSALFDVPGHPTYREDASVREARGNRRRPTKK